MKLFWTPLALAAITVGGLTGCATFPQSPVALANSTKLDERLAISAELSYTTATKLGTALAAARLIDPIRFKRLDNEAYQGLVIVRTAYEAGNSTDYNAGIARLAAAVAQINAMAKGPQNAH